MRPLGICLFLVLLLCGCTQTITRPYTCLADGVYAYEGTVWENGATREKTPADIQAMQYIPDDSGIDLTPGELTDYTGTLYSLSNYRVLLLQEGYAIESEIRTRDVLDTTLGRCGDRVRLIYQPSGRIRILFENPGGAAHILLEGVQ